MAGKRKPSNGKGGNGQGGLLPEGTRGVAKMERIRAELDRLCEANGGLLRPDIVVNAAKPAKSPLHSCFEWDDTKASHEYRLWQARQLIIHVRVTIPVRENEMVVVRNYESLPPDRHSNGGYRQIVNILTDTDLTRQLLDMAVGELNRLKRRFGDLQELAEVWAAFDDVVGRIAWVDGSGRINVMGGVVAQEEKGTSRKRGRGRRLEQEREREDRV